MAKGLWLRLYAEIIDNRKIQNLTDKQFRWWINLICLAKLSSGNLPKLADIAWKLRKPERETGAMIDALCSIGLLDRYEDGTVKPHDWNEHQYISDSSTERVRAFRNKNGNVSETFHETDRNCSNPVTETPRARAQSQSQRAESREQSRAEQSGASAPKNTPPLTAAEFAEPDRSAMAWGLVDAIAQTHWAPANIPQSRAAAETIIGTAVDPERVLGSIIANHKTWKRWHEANPRERRKRLEYWLRDGDYMHPAPAATVEAESPPERKWTKEEIAEAERKEDEMMTRLRAQNEAALKARRA